MNTNDFEAVGALLADDYVLEYPQSGEVIRGRYNFVAVNRHYPANGPWRFTVHTLLADGPQAVSDVSVTDSVVAARVITFSTVKDSLITRQLEFWPESFEPPEWRRAWAERA